MLTIRRVLAALLMVAATMLALTANTTVPAQADTDDPSCWVEGADGTLDYICGNDGGGGDQNDGGGGGGGPSCDLEMIDRKGVHAGARRWCEGENACWANIPALTEDEKDADTPKPDKKAVWIYKVCYTPGGDETADSGWQWYVPEEISIEELAAIAYGRLVTPAFTLATSPPEWSVIKVPTWWWAQGAGDGSIIGSAALGVRAVGAPSHLEVIPGDSDGATITCPWVTEESPRCAHTFERETDPGEPYVAQARLVYDIRFEQNGVEFEVAGLPGILASPWVETDVVVNEIGTRVTEVG